MNLPITLKQDASIVVDVHQSLPLPLSALLGGPTELYAGTVVGPGIVVAIAEHLAGLRDAKTVCDNHHVLRPVLVSYSVELGDKPVDKCTLFTNSSRYIGWCV